MTKPSVLLHDYIASLHTYANFGCSKQEIKDIKDKVDKLVCAAGIYYSEKPRLKRMISVLLGQLDSIDSFDQQNERLFASEFVLNGLLLMGFMITLVEDNFHENN